MNKINSLLTNQINMINQKNVLMKTCLKIIQSIKNKSKNKKSIILKI